jgi:hypothetical protein
MIFELKGNLHDKISANYGGNPLEFSLEDSTWLSDFQNKNEACPFHLGTLINSYFGTETIASSTKTKR